MDLYTHVRVIFAMIVGLSVAHLLQGAAKIVETPKRYKVYWVHLVWMLFVFLYLIHFWWWEFKLSNVGQWTFPLYVFVAFYAILLFLLSRLLFPNDVTDYDGFRGYYYSRRKWIFSLMMLLFIVDIGDTLIKGSEYLHTMGTVYYVRTALGLLMSALAIKIANPRYHAVFAVMAVVLEVLWILKIR